MMTESEICTFTSSPAKLLEKVKAEHIVKIFPELIYSDFFFGLS